ncbi:MAG: cupin domain-containing protein [Deltaproteobacteria bacterium]|nr:cupin domain-containing protein [Deltaproteobacteria bacterium]
MSKSNASDLQERIASLNASVQAHSLRGAWERGRGPARPDEILPAVWRWSDMAPLLTEAGELAPLDDVMRMRTLHMTNSTDTIPLGATRTFAAMLQHVNGGEVTDSHRHTATSVYFMIQGGGLYTTAEGEQQFMEPGDLLTQPSWTWHGTTNTGKDPAIWFTAMDSTLMQLLDVWQNERFPDSFSQPVTKPDGYYKKRLGALRAKGVIDNPGPYPVRYRWQESLALLEELNAAGESDPYDGVIADYVDPQTGGFTTASLHCRIQMLRPSEETESHRHSCNTVYHVARGAGVTKIGKSRTDGNGLDWAERDCFNVPTNYWHRFKNNSSKDPAILFSVSDRPLFEALRLYREEA